MRLNVARQVGERGRTTDRPSAAAAAIRALPALRIGIERAGIELTIEPYVPGQELDLTVRYWEGAVEAQGTAAGRPTTAVGYPRPAGY